MKPTSQRRRPLWKRLLRISLFSLGGFLLLFLLAAVLIPVLYGDEINERIKVEINNNVNAKVDYADFGLSLFSNFPLVSLNLEGLTVAGKGEFEGDTLANIGELQVAIDLWSLFGEEYQVNKIVLKQPRIHVIVLPNGLANYDIALPDSAKPDTSPSKFALKLNRYTIQDGDILYDDQQGGTYAHVVGLNHSGKGDFTQDVIALSTRTETQRVLVRQGKTTWLNNVKLGADLDLELDLPKSRYTFRDNEIRLNELALAFDGWLAMPDTNRMDMDLRFSATQTRFSNLLSMVPGMYTPEFGELKTDGSLALNGSLKGAMVGDRVPAFDVKLSVRDGSFQYPDLPEAVRNIQLDVHTFCTDGIVDNTTVNVKRLHLEFGNQPIDARALLQGLTAMNLDAQVKANVDLEQITKVFPVDGLDLKGKMLADVQAKGKLSGNTYPSVKGSLNLTNGYVKSADFPEAIKNLNVDVLANNSTGLPADTRIDIPKLHAEVAGDPIDGSASVQNLDDPAYDVTLNGKLDLTKLAKILDLTDMELAGQMNLALKTTGVLSDLEAERYDKLAAAGRLELRGLSYKSTDLPAGLKIATADFAFTPKAAVMTGFKGNLGSSDLALEGSVYNYMAWVLSDAPLKATLDLQSAKLDLNELMAESPASTAQAPETRPEQPEVPASTGLELPRNLDLHFKAQIAQILYDTYTLKDFAGGVILKDGRLELSNTRFTFLGATVQASGDLDTKNPAQPRFNFLFDLANLDVFKAHNEMKLVERLMPIAKNSTGTLFTNLSLNGNLDRDLNLNYSSLSGVGKLNTRNVVIKGAKALGKLAGMTKLADLSTLALDDANISASVSNGRVFVEPFDVNVNKKYKMTTSGSNGLDGSLDYRMILEAPRGKVATAALDAIGRLAKANIPSPETLRFGFDVRGNTDDPKIENFRLLTADGKDAKQDLKQNLQQQFDDKKQELKEDLDKKRQEAEQKAREEAERLRKEAEARRQAAEQKAREEAERLRKEAEARRQAAEQKAREEAERRKKEAQQKAEDELKNMKNKFKFP